MRVPRQLLLGRGASWGLLGSAAKGVGEDAAAVKAGEEVDAAEQHGLSGAHVHDFMLRERRREETKQAREERKSVDVRLSTLWWRWMLLMCE